MFWRRSYFALIGKDKALAWGATEFVKIGGLCSSGRR
jgi:hypothetical protein